MRAAALLMAGALLAGAPIAEAQAPNSISARDKADGAKAHPQLLQEFGGAYQGRQAAYVTSVGRRVAVQSGLSNAGSDFTITLLNSPVNNAFAIPGGYVYVTRQLLALMNDEAELASVLGHEIGHVAARHSQKRQTAATRNSILGGLGQILAGAVLGSGAAGDLVSRGIGQGTELLTLRFSRTQEYEADDLGIRYIAASGYDPLASSTMLASLAAQGTIDAQTRGTSNDTLPSWFSTHPDPGSRVQRARTRAQQTGARGSERDRETFLAAIDGMLYDDDPDQGIVDGGRFRHPKLRIQFQAPQGYALTNGTTAVAVTGRGGQAQFSGGSISGSDFAGYIGGVLQKVGAREPIGADRVQATRVNGLDAGYVTVRASTQQGQVDVGVFAYRTAPGTAYHFLTITPAGSGFGAFTPMLQSFASLSAAEAAAIKPRVVDVVTVSAGDTVQSLSRRMAYSDYQLQRFLTLNALPANAALRPGQKVKLIVYG